MRIKTGIIILLIIMLLMLGFDIWMICSIGKVTIDMPTFYGILAGAFIAWGIGLIIIFSDIKK